ncbi:hypothetical protein [Streptomyces sp. NBC_00120]|uniref:hypothetical protein n=1 Tax=unclassified Streptomyces TaxID=2593676 RepID=UPI00224F8C0E|nr:hypothetical protein [Streptomyces sp. NBC_00120]MCX5319908.1 hypothetical protein [Streptomyces sp. NBC_00120]
MAGRALRSGDQAGAEQEMWGLLTLYQAPRTVTLDAAESRPGTDPDRCGLTLALQSARDQVVQAVGVVTAHVVGVIGHKVLAGLLPARRQRVSTRKVKSPMSRYSDRHDDVRPAISRTVTGLDITIHEPPNSPPSLTRSRDDRYQTPAPPRAAGTGSCPCSNKTPPVYGSPANRGAFRGHHPAHHAQTALTLGRWRLIRKLGPGLYPAQLGRLLP